jgi:DNA-binding protein HU-beta
MTPGVNNILKGRILSMNKAELIAGMTEKSGLSRKDAENALNAFIQSVEESLSRGEKVQLIGFGSFEVRDRAERTGRNPQTMEEITIPASKVPVFKAGRAIKDMVNK